MDKDYEEDIAKNDSQSSEMDERMKHQQQQRQKVQELQEQNQEVLKKVGMKCVLCMISRIISALLFFATPILMGKMTKLDTISIVMPILSVIILALFLKGVKAGFRQLAIVLLLGNLMGLIRYIPSLSMLFQNEDILILVYMIGTTLCYLLQILFLALILLDTEYKKFAQAVNRVYKG